MARVYTPTQADVGITVPLDGKDNLSSRYVVDVSSWRDPKAQQLKGARNPALQKWMLQDPRVAALAADVLLHADVWERKLDDVYFGVCILDTTQRIGDVVAEIIANTLEKEGFNVYVKTNLPTN